MKQKLSSLVLLTLFISIQAYCRISDSGTPVSEETVTFRFVSGNDMFYTPWGGNDAELTRLYALVDKYRREITGGSLPVYIDGYCASLPTTRENLNTAFIRANRVKSELITHKNLREEHFITGNHATPYEGRRDVVIVTLRIPAPLKESLPEPKEATGQTPDPQPEPMVETKPGPEPEPTVTPIPANLWVDSYRFALRTNLLYDALLLPTLGIEWRVNRRVGILTDASLSHWGGNTGKVQKVWAVSPEVRRYLGASNRFYIGVGGNYADYNIYKYPAGRLFSSDTGYQGTLWSVGLTTGYQLRLSGAFSLNFHIGLGYTRSEYDSFNLINDTRVYRDRNKTKNLWGPTQAGISLVWRL